MLGNSYDSRILCRLPSVFVLVLVLRFFFSCGRAYQVDFEHTGSEFSQATSKDLQCRAGESAQQLRAPVALAKDLGLIPSTYMDAHHYPWLQFQRVWYPRLTSEDTCHASGTLTYMQVGAYTCNIKFKRYFKIFIADLNIAALLLLLCNPSLTLSWIILALVILLDFLLFPLLLDFCPPCSLIFSKKSCNSLITGFSFFPSPLLHRISLLPERKGHISNGNRQLFVSISAWGLCLFSSLTVPYGSFDWSLLPPFPPGEIVIAGLVAEALIFFCGCELSALVGSGWDVCLLVVFC